MKISDIILESKNSFYDKIINTEFFKINILPNIDKPLDEIPCLLHGGNIAGNRKVVKARTKSYETKPIFHNIINKHSNEKFGIYVRNLFFTTQRLRTAENYGDPMIVFPLDDYDLYYSDTFEDMFINLGMGTDDLKTERIVGVTSVIHSPPIKEKLKIVIDELNEKSTEHHTPEDVVQSILNILEKRIRNDEIAPFATKSMPETEEELKSKYNDETIQEVRDVLLSGLHHPYKIRKISDVVITIMTEVTDVLTKSIIESDIKFVNKIAKQYIDTVYKTKRMEDIDYKHEIMATPGRYAIIKITTYNTLGPLREIVEYYHENK